MKKTSLIFAGFSLGYIPSAFAICPLCTVAVGAGLGLAEWLGIDDTISGLWIGGLIVSLITWTIYWLDKKDIHFKGRKILITLLYYVVLVVPLYPLAHIGHPLHTLWGVDKLLLGIILGSVFFFLGYISYLGLKKAHGGHADFPFQKIVMPVAPLIVLSIIFYFITR